MKGQKFARKNWCLLRDNERLRATIEFKIKQSGLSLVQLGKLSGLDPKRISRWRLMYTRHLTQHQLITLCNTLGIDVDLTVKFKDE